MPSEIELQRIKRRAEKLCHIRNENLPLTQGKSSFDIQGEQFIFYKAMFSVDSMRCQHELEVAKLQYDMTGKQWHLLVRSEANKKDQWQAHLFHPVHVDVLNLLTVIEKDADECIWS